MLRAKSGQRGPSRLPGESPKHGQLRRHVVDFFAAHTRIVFEEISVCSGVSAEAATRLYFLAQ
eukprot:2878224-Amphidinium_carterae.1